MVPAEWTLNHESSARRAHACSHNTFKSSSLFMRRHCCNCAGTLTACGGGGDSGDNSFGNESHADHRQRRASCSPTRRPTSSARSSPRSRASTCSATPAARPTCSSGPETVDCSTMRNYTDFFSIDPVVPVGTYEKVRMTLSDLALVECDAAGVPEPAGRLGAPAPARQRQARPESARHVRGDRRRDDGHRTRHGHEQVAARPPDGQRQVAVPPGRVRDHPPDDTQAGARVRRVRATSARTRSSCARSSPCRRWTTTSPTPSTECIDVFTDAETGIFDETGTPVDMSASRTTTC